MNEENECVNEWNECMSEWNESMNEWNEWMNGWMEWMCTKMNWWNERNEWIKWMSEYKRVPLPNLSRKSIFFNFSNLVKFVSKNTFLKKLSSYPVVVLNGVLKTDADSSV
jgi:hypothetical protein